MILLELKAIFINILFGITLNIFINFFSFYEEKSKRKILYNFLYFFLVIFITYLYILAFDGYKVRFYFLIFLSIGFYLGKYFNPVKRIDVFNYFVKNFLKYLKKVFLFSINYEFFYKLIKIIKNKR